MIANWLESTLILSPENERDEQALSALAQGCTPLPKEAMTRTRVIAEERAKIVSFQPPPQ